MVSVYSARSASDPLARADARWGTVRRSQSANDASMLDHISFGVADLARSAAFYDAVLAPLGVERVWSDRDAVGYGYAGGADAFAIKQTTRPASTGSERSHLAFAARDRASVTAFYLAAVARGAADEGAPGLCPEYGDDYFAAFVRDPDGYQLEAVCHDFTKRPTHVSVFRHLHSA